MNAPPDAEREFAKEVAEFAAMAGWDRAIQSYAKDSGMKEEQVILILNRVSEYNSSADPRGRVDALSDWERHKQTPEVGLPAKGGGKSVGA